jgi:hypothetical protein
VYFNNAGTLTFTDDEMSFVDTLIRIRDTENNNRPDVPPKYIYVHPNSHYAYYPELVQIPNFPERSSENKLG